MRYLLSLLLLLAGCGGCASVPSHDDLRATALRLEFGPYVCSGVAIGPDTLLSAQHCAKAAPLKAVNGQRVKVIGVGRDKHDLITIKVSGIRFAHWARFGPPMKEGDRVKWWGQPARQEYVYREGYVARVTPQEIWIDAQLFGGDSGSGVYDEQGRVVGVITGVRGWRDAAGFSFSMAVVYPR
jgi:V8-like Glu-specific endopeptidase